VENIINALNILLPTLYALSWALYALLFFRNDPFAERTAPLLLYASGALHALDIVLRALFFRHFPVATLFEAFSVLALAILVVYLLIEWRIGVRTTGMFIVGIVFIFQLVSSAFITSPPEVNELLMDPTFVLHASTAVLGYSGMAISAVYGLLYLMLFYDIKKQRFGLIYKQLPSLEVMAGFTYRSAILGFVFLTVAMGLGLLLLVKVYGTYWKWDPKLAVTFIAWLIYSIGVGAGTFWGWSARRVAFASLAGFAVILFSLVVVNFFFTAFHEFV
jgi:ABC-type transport system involved in cytochrome c biogenesis permease subunit